MNTDDPQVSPLGDRRDKPVPCRRCRRNTLNIRAVCDACLAKEGEHAQQ